MDFIELNQTGDCIVDLSAEQLLSLDSSDAYDVFGDPEVTPRVGDQYQVNIPPLIMEYDYFLKTKNPMEAENSTVRCDFLMGLPIPTMWIDEGVENMKHEKMNFFGDSNDATNKSGRSERTCLDYGVGIRESANLASEDKMCQYLVPGSCGDSWSDIEKASFLLGLYIFEKNFVEVKRFIESKKMGEMLSFYYGKFYRSDEYRRWSACRKMRSKRCVYGQRIFSGVRQQELLSRMLPHVSEECQNALLEVSRTFEEGKMPLEEYVSSLKAMVGMNTLVEAVGIGKGKQDLTGIAIEHSKSNQVPHIRPEVPTGKACSSLTPSEIIKFLTGDYRLSKTRSNDLFWEAVWPRLLARGWHSEQPTNQSYKHSLVFLIPGVEKFLRRRLVKGTDYFDSVTDVLSKVASEPGLLELENEEDEGKMSKEEDGCTNEVKSEELDLPERRRHCYLQPRTPSRNNTDMKTRFTVVDTSLTDGRNFKVRELRSLPMEILKIRSFSEHSDEGSFEVPTDESDCAYIMLVDREETSKTKPTRNIADRGMFSEREDLEISALGKGIFKNGSDSTNVIVKNSKSQKKLYKDKGATKDVNCHSSRRLKQVNLDDFAPVSKRQRKLSACNTELTGSSKGSPVEIIEDTHNVNSHGAQPLYEEPQPQRLFDLNIRQAPLDSETDVSVIKLEKGEDDQTTKEHKSPCALKTSVGEGSLEQQPNVNWRRQSTRNRPPTVRALEALANGFLTINRRKKSKDANHTSRPSQRVTECSTGNASTVREGGRGVCDGGNSNMLGEFHVLSKGNET